MGLDEFIRRFEAGSQTKEEWIHADHLRIVAWYVSRFSVEEAGVRIPVGIRHLNECLRGENTEDGGFYEMLTEFWIREVRAHMAVHGDDLESLCALPPGVR